MIRITIATGLLLTFLRAPVLATDFTWKSRTLKPSSSSRISH